MIAVALLAQLVLSPAASPSLPTGCMGARKILTYGDSKTVWAIGANNNQLVWQELMQRTLGCQITFNIGTGDYFPGSIATNGITVAGREDIIVADLAAVLDTPDAILFNLGSNDAFFEMPEEAAWKADLATIWDAMHTKWPNAPIYYSLTWREDQDADSDTLAGWYAAVAAGRDYVHLCDDERVWVKGTPTNFWDGIHFSAAGAAEKARLAATCLGF